MIRKYNSLLNPHICICKGHIVDLCVLYNSKSAKNIYSLSSNLKQQLNKHLITFISYLSLILFVTVDPDNVS